jgi:hypothetical protein
MRINQRFIIALCLLGLAGQTIAATFVVTTSLDSGPGSFRQAILDANGNPGPDDIDFNIPGPGVHTIQPLTALPFVTEPVTVDGSLPGGSPGIELDGSLSAPGPMVNGETPGLTLSNHLGSTVRGLIVNEFSHGGILVLAGGSHVIAGNYLGTDATGTIAAGNGSGGGGFIWSGVVVTNSSDNRIGGLPDGPDPADRNVLSGNAFGGIEVLGFVSADPLFSPGPADNNVIAGNHVGTDVTGTNNLGNVHYGIYMEASNNNDVASNLAAHNNRNIAVAFGLENIVRDNVVEDAGNQGIILAFNSDENVVSDNIVLDSAREGIEIFGTFGNIPALSSDSNVIEGNEVTGSSWGDPVVGAILIQGGTNNIIRENTVSEGFASGIHFPNGPIDTSNNTIEGNIIFDNARSGIEIHEIAGFPGQVVGNLISANSVFSNDALGIDLSFFVPTIVDGVTPNDPLDVDTGPNMLQNFPVLSSRSVWNPAQVVAKGVLESAPNTTYVIELFASAEADPSGHGEGEQFIGSISATTNKKGFARFTAPTGVSNLVGDGQTAFLTATATDPDGNTSEFGPALQIERVGR